MAKETFTKEEVLLIIEFCSDAIYYGVNWNEYVGTPEELLTKYLTTTIE